MGMVVVGLGFGVGACSDSTTEPTPTGSSMISVMHANPAYTSDVIPKRESTTLASALSYGGSASVSVPNGNSTITFAATDGTELASAQAQLDSSHSAWVIFSGDANERTGFAVVSKKISISSGNAAVRVIQASKTAPPVKIRINDINGLALTNGSIPYKSGSDFVNVPVATTTDLIVVNNNTSDSLMAVPLTLQAGSQYTVVIYGSASVTGQYGLTSKVFVDPQ
jgi:hypothetical protein